LNNFASARTLLPPRWLFKIAVQVRNSAPKGLFTFQDDQTMETAAKLGISMKEVTDKLTDDGVRLFAEAFDKLLEVVEKSFSR